jgi:hypothetical protein
MKFFRYPVVDRFGGTQMFARSTMIATVAILVGAVVWLGFQFSEQSQRITMLEREVSITEQMARYAESGAIDAQSVAQDASVKAIGMEQAEADTSVISPDVAPRRRRIASSYDSGPTQVDSIDRPSNFGAAQPDLFGR